MSYHEQLEKVKSIFDTNAYKHKYTLKVIGTHRSKSIELPVIQIDIQDYCFILRDNFYNINCWIQSTKPITVPFSVFYKQYDFFWYVSEIQRAQNYLFKGWTTEEIDDPRILRVKVNNLWRTISSQAKDRWLNRYLNTDWYRIDWSALTLIPTSSPITAITTFYKADHCYLEGIKNTNPKHYDIGSQDFVICTQWTELETIVKTILGD